MSNKEEKISEIIHNMKNSISYTYTCNDLILNTIKNEKYKNLIKISLTNLKEIIDKIDKMTIILHKIDEKYIDELSILFKK